MQIIFRRVLMAIPTLLLLSLVVFLLLELAPGDAATTTLDITASSEQSDYLRDELGLGQSVLARYAGYIGGLFRGDLGISAKSGQPVADEIAIRLPYTLLLVSASMALGTIIGVTLGAVAAFHVGKRIDWLVTALVSIATALPTFWLAMLFVQFFALRLRLLPVFGADSWQHLVLPAFCTSLTLVPGIARLTRASLLDTIKSDCILFARAKGLRQRRVIWRHVSPLAAISVVTYIGLQSIRLISSVAVMEILFNWPGLGGLAVRAAFDRDTTLLLGTTLVIAALTFAILFMVDVVVLYLDPRISRKAI